MRAPERFQSSGPCHAISIAGQPQRSPAVGGPGATREGTMPTAKERGAIPAETTGALVSGTLDDPARILGPHPDDAGSLRITTFLPGAATVRVLPLGGRRQPRAMTRLHPAGLFS